MTFKHTFNVFVDNFNATYKLLLYRVIVWLVAAIICYFAINPFVKGLIHSDSFNALYTGGKSFLLNLLNGNMAELSDISQKVKDAYAEFIVLLRTKTTQFVLSGLLLLVVYLVSQWFSALGNFSAAALINDKMSLRTNSPFVSTLIKNLKQASLYGLIYVPLSLLYDFAVCAIMFLLAFYLLNSFLPFTVCLFVFVCCITVSIAFKMTFTTDWLPAIIRGKMGQKKSFVYTFNRKNKNTFSVLSNFFVLIIIIFGLNVAAVICTLGVGILLTLPSSFVILLSFEFVNYYDREGIKYFIDKNTIIKPETEKSLTREEFFRGEDE